VAEVGEDAGAGVEELGLAGGEVVGEAGGFEELVGGGAESDFGAGLEAVLGEGGVGGVEFGVEEGGVEGEDAVEAPLDAGELADEVVFEVVLGEQDAGDFVDEAFEGGVVFVAKDEEGAGIAAVFEGVEGRAELALGGFGAAAFGAGVAGCVVLRVVVVEIHDFHLPRGIICGGQRVFGGVFRGGGGKWFGMRGMGTRDKFRSDVIERRRYGLPRIAASIH
jgi:hypothetical protein